MIIANIKRAPAYATMLIALVGVALVVAVVLGSTLRQPASNPQQVLPALPQSNVVTDVTDAASLDAAAAGAAEPVIVFGPVVIDLDKVRNQDIRDKGCRAGKECGPDNPAIFPVPDVVTAP